MSNVSNMNHNVRYLLHNFIVPLTLLLLGPLDLLNWN